MNIGIVGLGLIGGSMAKSTKARTAHTVYGTDLQPETMLFAKLSGAIDGELKDEALALCDLVIVALCPGAAVEWVRAKGALIPKSAILVDICGVKRKVCAELGAAAHEHGFLYVGGHPMAGIERGGFVNSTDSLFVGADMILTPDHDTEAPTLEKLKTFFKDIGFGSITYTTPEEHDRIIAYTSQLAHIASSAYVKSPEAQRRRGFSAGSFADMTRVARLNEDMWTELFSENADFLTEQLDIYIKNLSEYLEALRAGDRELLHRLLKDGREKKAAAGGC